MPVSLIGYDVFGLVSLIVIGLIIILLIGLVLILVPAVSIAFTVWYLAGNTWWAGIAFLVIAALSILKKL
jgi:hypothetical protein